MRAELPDGTFAKVKLPSLPEILDRLLHFETKMFVFAGIKTSNKIDVSLDEYVCLLLSQVSRIKYLKI